METLKSQQGQNIQLINNSVAVAKKHEASPEHDDPKPKEPSSTTFQPAAETLQQSQPSSECSERGPDPVIPIPEQQDAAPLVVTQDSGVTILEEKAGADAQLPPKEEHKSPGAVPASAEVTAPAIDTTQIVLRREYLIKLKNGVRGLYTGQMQ